MGDLQTALAMIPAPDIGLVTQGEQSFLVDAGPDETGANPGGRVRLAAVYTPRLAHQPRRGLVMTLHGWEGCSHSHYNLLVGSELVRRGYDVVRLNYRDHGETQHLNRGLFYAALLGEVQRAAEQIAALAHGAPFYIVGASLGGSFALRMALHWQRDRAVTPTRVVAINPVLDPLKTTYTLDRHPVYRYYFRKRWSASLRRKQALYPDLYDFSPVYAIPQIYEMTDWMMRRYGPYTDAADYLRSYAVLGKQTATLQAPTVILTAANDPIIDVADFRELAPHPLLRLVIHPSGGHVGYVDGPPLRHRLADLVLPWIEEASP